MRTVLAVIAALLPGVLFAQQTPAQPAARLTLYKTADSAACPPDIAVWVDADTLVYYVKGEGPYGKTKRGGYSCRRQAEAAGYRPSKPR